MPTTKQRIRESVSGVVDIPPRATWPYTMPGAPELLHLRWQARLRRAPVISAEEHAERVGVKDIEEVIGCSLCDERRVQPLFSPKGKKWRYEVVRCPSCGFLYRHPGIRPERLGELYAGKYSSFLTGNYAKKRSRRYRLVMDAFAPLFAEGAGRRLFDFGCGAGLFLEEAHARGFDGYGVDLSPDSIEEARTKPSGQKTWLGTPMEVPEIAAGGFDVVTLWSVLAHLPCPVEDLTMLHDLLAPDGVLLLLTVNANSLELKDQGDDWNGFTKNHLKFFSPETLPLLMRRAGFGALAFRPMYPDPVEAGTTKLSSAAESRLRRVTDRGNQGNMMRAVAFRDPEGPARWGIGGALRL